MKALMIVVALVIGFIVQGANAACSKATIKGNYGLVGNVVATDEYDVLAVYVMGRTNFDGAGKIKITNSKVSAFGEVQSISATGNYNLRANCIGTASLTIRSAGSVIGRMRFDMVVSGTANSPQIGVVYTSTTDLESGQFFLSKIRI